MSSKGILSEKLVDWAVRTTPSKPRSILNEAWMKDEETCESSECAEDGNSVSSTSSTRALQDNDVIEIVDEADEGDPEAIEARALAAEDALADAICDEGTTVATIMPVFEEWRDAWNAGEPEEEPIGKELEELITTRLMDLLGNPNIEFRKLCKLDSCYDGLAELVRERCSWK